jgi:uncharacterized Zn finger protein
MFTSDTPPIEPPAHRINLNDAQDVKCDKCGDFRFEPIYLIKKLSKLISPTGNEELIPLGPPLIPPIFACYACGHVNEEFIPAPLRFKKKQEESGIVSSDLDSVGSSNKPNLTLTR